MLSLKITPFLVVAFAFGVTSQATTTTSAASYDQPPTACQQQLDSCLAAPFPNHSFCTSQFCQCTGGVGSACAGDSTTSSLPPDYTPPPAECQQQLDACLAAPFPNHSFCTSQFCQCTGNIGSACAGNSNTTTTTRSNVCEPITTTTSSSSSLLTLTMVPSYCTTLGQPTTLPPPNSVPTPTPSGDSGDTGAGGDTGSSGSSGAGGAGRDSGSSGDTGTGGNGGAAQDQGSSGYSAPVPQYTGAATLLDIPSTGAIFAFLGGLLALFA